MGLFPHLDEEGYSETSAATLEYNCIAWAAGKTDDWWWPDAFGAYYWPEGLARIETIESSAHAFATIGYQPCNDGALEALHEKVALNARDGKPTHAARQLPNGLWTSKRGGHIDISHTLRGLEDSLYGRVAAYLKRPLNGGQSDGV